APGAIGLPFDSEGTPRRRFELVAGGVTTNVAHDRRTAAQVGATSTGDAPQGGRTLGPVPLTIMMLANGQPATGAAGSASGLDRPAGDVDGPAADSSVAALLAGVERGLLVSDFWYTRVLDPRPLVVTGLTRNGVWLIENGEVTGAVKNLRFT